MTSTVGLLLALFLSQAQPPTLDLALARAATFATAFHHDCGRLIADESYVQVYSRSPSSPWMIQSLRSDFAMIADENLAGWHAFRDVVEVNGEPVEGHAGGRLARVLSAGPGSLAEAERIASESTRHLLFGSSGVRNAPPVALLVLLPAQQPRFTFARRGDRRVGEISAWVVRFEEIRGPGFFKDTTGRDLPITGEFWIDPHTGIVLRSQLVIEGGAPSRLAGRTTGNDLAANPGNPRISVEVFYKPDPALAMTVPVEMRETFSHDVMTQTGGPQIDSLSAVHFTREELASVATYTHYRRLPASVPTEAEARR